MSSSHRLRGPSEKGFSEALLLDTLFVVCARSDELSRRLA